MTEKELILTLENMTSVTRKLEKHYEFLLICKSDDKEAMVNLYNTRHKLNGILKNLYEAEKQLIEYSFELNID